MPQVRLTSLPVIRRYSLAVRQEWADAATLLEALEASLAEVRRALDTRAAGVGGVPQSPDRDGDERLREEP